MRRQRTVHARRGEVELARYAPGGRWYVERGTDRRLVTIGEAARIAVSWEHTGGRFFPDLPGGRTIWPKFRRERSRARQLTCPDLPGAVRHDSAVDPTEPAGDGAALLAEAALTIAERAEGTNDHARWRTYEDTERGKRAPYVGTDDEYGSVLLRQVWPDERDAEHAAGWDPHSARSNAALLLALAEHADALPEAVLAAARAHARTYLRC